MITARELLEYLNRLPEHVLDRPVVLMRYERNEYGNKIRNVRAFRDVFGVEVRSDARDRCGSRSPAPHH